MGKPILQRYAVTPDGIFIIDVSAQRTEDLYNNFDRTSPYIRKDLDEELSRYLVESAREIGDRPTLIRINLEQPATVELRERIKRSSVSFFTYMAQVEAMNMLQMARRSGILFIVGLCLLVIAVLAHQQVEQVSSLFAKVIAEGITVAAWVSLWEALATFLIKWSPYHKKRKIYRRLAAMPVEFSQT